MTLKSVRHMSQMEGASLEALAKGAVQFSRRYTFEELKNRWHSLLYDPDISAQASACMVELQGSSKVKESKIVREKRKIGSIRKQYFSMRKRIRSEFFSSDDLGFLTEPDVHNCTGNGADFHGQVTLHNVPSVVNSMIRDCIPNHFGLQESDFDMLHDTFPQTITDITATNAIADVGNAFRSEDQDSLAANQISTIARNNCLHGFPEDVSSLSVQGSLRNEGNKSFEQTHEIKDIPHNVEDNQVDFGKSSGVEEMDTSRSLSCTKLLETDGSEAKPLSTFDSSNSKLEDDCSEIGAKQHFGCLTADCSDSFHTMGFSSPLPSMPLWKTMEDISAPCMPINNSPEDKGQAAEYVSELPDKDNAKSKSSLEHAVRHSGATLADKHNSDGFFSSAAISDSEFVDLPDSLLDFSNEDGVLFVDVDRKSTLDKSGCDTTLESGYHNKLLLSSSKDVDEGDPAKVEPKTILPSTGIAAGDGSCVGKPEAIASHFHTASSDQQSVPHSGNRMLSASILNSKSHERSEGIIICTLNTEDPEIPCNDDIFLLIHPATAFNSSTISPITIDTMSCGNEKGNGQCLNLTKKVEDPAQSFRSPFMVGPYMLPQTGSDDSIVGCTVQSDVSDGSCMALPPRHKVIGNTNQLKLAHTTISTADGKLEKDVRKVELGVIDPPGTFRELSLNAEAGAVELTLPVPVVNPTTSDLEEPESNDDVPYFSDIEAMILEMDLCSYDDDTYFSRRVSRYQHDDSKRKIVRLEQSARSSLQRTIASQGALAILYGRQSKHFIRKTEVILGRSTEEIDVDIDLSKEGRGNKISRRQAIVKMEDDGSFFLKNLGKSSISLNGRTVGTGQLMGLTSCCLIEIRGTSLVFEINHKSVRRYLDNTAKKSQELRTNFKWSPEEEPALS
ncbi:uncharacterized protein LOC127804046 isoform X2 [Diospyros lotus]|uniref:uncharacterized protein LOC127804046 isoform X2 n=1 Tax=Diospyros lotus TaxID=55363 RepID=UPI00225A1865|nr:uncharacterized protein LOC127804046 isoform X2 [Diospyros lotus]